MNAKHTPRPWTVGLDDEFGGWPFIEINAPFTEHHPEGTRKVAEVQPQDGEDAEELGEQTRANAHLIAAAPELLEAAKWAVKALERYDNAIGIQVGDGALTALGLLNAAIAKARYNEIN